MYGSREMVYHYVAIGCNIGTPIYGKEIWMNAMVYFEVSTRPCWESYTDREHMEQQGAAICVTG